MSTQKRDETRHFWTHEHRGHTGLQVGDIATGSGCAWDSKEERIISMRNAKDLIAERGEDHGIESLEETLGGHSLATWRVDVCYDGLVHGHLDGMIRFRADEYGECDLADDGSSPSLTRFLDGLEQITHGNLEDLRGLRSLFLGERMTGVTSSEQLRNYGLPYVIPIPLTYDLPRDEAGQKDVRAWSISIADLRRALERPGQFICPTKDAYYARRDRGGRDFVLALSSKDGERLVAFGREPRLGDARFAAERYNREVSLEDLEKNETVHLLEPGTLFLLDEAFLSRLLALISFYERFIAPFEEGLLGVAKIPRKGPAPRAPKEGAPSNQHHDRRTGRGSIGEQLKRKLDRDRDQQRSGSDG